MKNEIISLVKKEYTQDDYGVSREVETIKNNILCEIASASSKEWFEGGRNGINPTYKFSINRIEYDGEETVEYNNVRYQVYRTYIKGDRIELHVREEKGA